MMRTFIFVSVLIFVLSACSDKKWDIDISESKVEVEFKRLDMTLFDMDHDNIGPNLAVIEEEYGSFFDLYNQAVINIGSINNLDYTDKLIYFLTDPYISDAYKQIKKTDYTKQFTQIEDGFKRYNYYFPNKVIPYVYTHVSGFNQSIVIDSGLVSISLDKYLGSDSKYYNMLRTPRYLQQNMHKLKIPADVLFAWALTEFPYHEKDDKLSSRMVYYGKLHVLMDALLPETADTLKWGFADQKLKWCKQNERQMWLYLIEKKLLFSSDFKEMKRFIDDGPFTTPFSKESPSRTGRWLGYQIVNSYLKNNHNGGLKELMETNDYQQILNESKYKP